MYQSERLTLKLKELYGDEAIRFPDFPAIAIRVKPTLRVELAYI